MASVAMPCLLKLGTLGFDRHEPLRGGDHDGVVVRRILPGHAGDAWIAQPAF